VICPDNRAEIEALQGDCGSYLGYVRMVGRRRDNVKLEDPIVFIPTEYTKSPLLRSTEQ